VVPWARWLGLTLEPALLGLLVQPLRRAHVAAAVVVLLVRTPLKLVLVDATDTRPRPHCRSPPCSSVRCCSRW
jgi:hypothetical protein